MVVWVPQKRLLYVLVLALFDFLAWSGRIPCNTSLIVSHRFLVLADR